MEYGWMMVRTLFVLGAVCALAYGLLRWGLRRFVPVGARGAGRMEVVDRLGVAPKQSILVVRVGSRHLLIGSSEAGLQNLGEIDGGDMQIDADQLDSSVSELDGAPISPPRTGTPENYEVLESIHENS